MTKSQEKQMLFVLATLLLFRFSFSFSPKEETSWRPLPHVGRRDVLLSPIVPTLALSSSPAKAGVTGRPEGRRSVIEIGSNPAIPVWPTWGGGKVVPVSLGGAFQDPFLLLAHHDHWFDPRDPLRDPFKAAGKAVGLPYVDVEGFSMHPHRGFDIFTYILDGSDGFQHRDSMGETSKLYRGGTCQWMRTGSGVQHEEFWETNSKRRTNIELFQLWVNLPSSRKFDEPAIEYIGKDTPHRWIETEILDFKSGNAVGSVRNISATLDKATMSTDSSEEASPTVVHPRPAIHILHTKLQPGAQWNLQTPVEHSAVIYVRQGMASVLGNGESTIVKIRQTATFAPDGDKITIQNAEKKNDLDMLILTAMPLREPIVSAGPIVMNTADEINDAYQQLQSGTFLKREYVLEQQRARGYW
eukprot:CAMPEP_0113299316 /NCGR_PEP_ID=MMETSP0010_2-20120614/1401_1 /TAXON_ID=216773 ORGANISM="Corethron hystrix, Strain 308" /NCGR_SAMPLE_ID=MMETSP0010_2 /ASSEMBLY_ACC=CAM_ASM_000155 /LENGTH=412 /DNA_ID=CAMNT_0000152529 /DNA_START=279 /DNA_END=1514 /DNA_ORIENTATION=- /assembly_acc=CAM_ASM_000155